MEKSPLITKDAKSKRHRDPNVGSSAKYSSSQKSRKSTGGSSLGTSMSSRRPSLAIPKELPFSVMRVRLVSSVVIILSGMSYFPLTIFISQYLLTRLIEDAVKEAIITRNSTIIDFNAVQEDATRKLQHYTYLQCAPALLSTLLFGAYSDFIGRRITLLLPILGQVAKCSIILCIVKHKWDYDYFYLAYGLDGICGSWFLALTAIYSITADTNFYKSQRLLWIMISGGLANVASSASAVINADLIEDGEFTTPAMLLVIYMSTAFVVPLIFLQETRPQPDKTLVNPFKSLKRIFGIFTTEGELKHRMTLVTLMIMFFFAIINDIGCPSIDVLYQMSPPFMFSSDDVGLYAGLKIGGQALVGMFLMKGLQRFLKAEQIGMMASFFQTGMYVLESQVEYRWQMFMVPVVGIPGCLISPTVRGIMSVLAGPDNQGAVFASVAIVECLSTIAATATFYEVYARTVADYSGAVYFTMAGYAVMPLLLFIPYYQLYEYGNHEYYYEEYVDVPSEYLGSGTMSVSLSISREEVNREKEPEKVTLEETKTNSVEYDIGHNK